MNIFFNKIKIFTLNVYNILVKLLFSINLQALKSFQFLNYLFYYIICDNASRLLNDINYRIFYNNNKGNFTMLKSDLEQLYFTLTIKERLDLLTIFRNILF